MAYTLTGVRGNDDEGKLTVEDEFQLLSKFDVCDLFIVMAQLKV